MAHMIMEDKKFYNLLSASWRTKKAGDIIQFWFNVLELGGCWYKSQSESKNQECWYSRAKEMDVLAQAERVNLPFLYLFVLLGL